jgi:hypothetical protein
MSEWNLSYEEWIIGDGQPDREVGEVFDWFSIAFWTWEPLKKTEERLRSVIAIPDFKYRVVAEVVFLSENACVIDFGLGATASSDRLLLPCEIGQYVTGEIRLSLPLCTEVLPDDTSKNLMHRWKINRISADLTPHVASPDNPRFFTRDETRVRHQDVQSTQTVKVTDYILHCVEVVPPASEQLR